MSLVENNDYGDIEDVCEAAIPKSRKAAQSQTNRNDILCYPNPSSGIYQLILPSTEGKLSYSIADLMGTIIVAKSITASDSRSQQIDITDHHAGVYYLSITEGNKLLSSQKLILIK